MTRPDNCDGTYQASCDSSRAYTNISDILTAQDRTDLLSYMQTYWVSDDGSDEAFWEHEWSKHGTCINTIKPSCYTNYSPQEEVGDYFQKVVDLFKSLDTYKVSLPLPIPYSSPAIMTITGVVRGGYHPLQLEDIRAQ
jgi:ribonuclease T2